MDGFTAVKAMREWESDHRRPRTPVIALTAYGLAAEVAKCAAAGCTAYVSKPVRKDVLLEEIVKHIDREPIRVGSHLREILPGYIERKRADVDALARAIEAEDYEAATVIGHRMKGTGSGYGLDELTRLGGDIERAGTARDAGRLEQLRTSLAYFLENVKVVYD